MVIYKSTGAPLGRNKEDDIPIYHKNPTKNQISLDSHIALANPRTKDSEKNLILRRSYNYSRSVDDQGLLDQGMIFICFQKSLQDGFLAIQNRLNGEMLEEYNTPVGGGFFYALPGVEKGSFLGEKLFL